MFATERSLKIHQLGADEALASLRSQAAGLSSEEAARRLLELGPNEVAEILGEPLWIRFLRGFTHFFAVILWLAAGLAFIAEWRDPGHGMGTLGLAIIGVILVNNAFSFWQEYRADRALSALQGLLPHQVNVRRDSGILRMPAVELVPGDIVLLEAGQLVPADCRLIEAFGVRVNNATVTGESLPHARDARPCTEAEFQHSRNALLAGTNLVGGTATAVVVATGAHTLFGQMARLTQEQKAPLSPLQQEIARLSVLVAFMAVGLGVTFFLIGQAMGLPFWTNFLFAIGIIVANVPEGLLPTVTLALALASQRMAKRNAVVRYLPAVETLGAATVICTDKTGTLTQNRMTVQGLILAATGETCATLTLPRDMKQLAGHEQRAIAAARLLATAPPQLLACALWCGDVKLALNHGKIEAIGDPLEVALVELTQAARLVPEQPTLEKIDEIPFDSERRRMSTIHRDADGLVLYCKGAPENVLPDCVAVDLQGVIAPLSPRLQAVFRQQEAAATEAGLRVLALAYRRLPDDYQHDGAERELVLAGLAVFEDPPRPEVPAAIRQCRDAGIKVIMVTGDHPRTALAVARQIGLIESAHPVVLSGEQLIKLSDIQLQLALDAPEILFARVAAGQKTRIVAALKRKNHIVAVTGDGVNDAPALRAADIGISMGLSGTDVARASADIILLDDNFATIVAAIEEGRAVYANIRKFLTYILASNIPELVPYLAFALFKVPLALTVIQILAVDLGTDMVPALALGAEPPGSRSMQEPPRSTRERLLDFRLIALAYLWLGPMQAVAAMAAFFFVLDRGGWSYGQVMAAQDPLYLQATTACLMAIVVMQVANLFICRSLGRPGFTVNISANRLIAAGITVELGLMAIIAYTPFGNLVFGTAPIPVAAWLFVIPFALCMLALEAGRKWIRSGR